MKEEPKQTDIWSLIQAGSFEMACELADLEYENSHEIFPLRNKVYALFHLGRFQECITLTQKLISDDNGQTSFDLIFCGIAHWLLNRKEEAINFWKNAELSIYKDAAGGIDIQVFLYFASITIKDKFLQKITITKFKKLLKTKNANNWPAPIGMYLVNQISESDLLSKISGVPILKTRQLCQAYFAIAVNKLEYGNIKEFKEFLGKCIGLGSTSYLEQMYYLAKGELENKL